MGELYNPYPKLPKNIRQIGERDQVVKLYMEDYVNTYLKRLYPAGGQDLRVGLLLGNMEVHDGTPYIFIDGAMEMEDVINDGEKVEFTELAWKRAYQNMEQIFPKRTIQGWFLCGTAGCQLSPLDYWKQHGQCFPGKNQLMYLNSGLEGEESIYITSEDGFYRLQGHAIYYERNQIMQDYMVIRKDDRRVESGSNDTIIRDFRQRMDEKKAEISSRRNAVGILGGLCSALAVVVLAGGIVMFNNYEKMRQLESVIASVMPDASKQKLGIAINLDEDDLIIEEACGDVFPTTEAEIVPFSAAAEDIITVAETGADPVSVTTAPTGAEAQSAAKEASKEIGPSTELVEAATATGKVYVVEDGDTLYGICYKLFGTLGELEEICNLNGLDDQNKIFSGQNLILP